jgi:RHS repeat-associated protein
VVSVKSLFNKTWNQTATFGYYTTGGNAGNLKWSKDAVGVNTTFYYDSAYSWAYVTGMSQTAKYRYNTTYAYDLGSGRIISVREPGRPQATTDYVYDKIGRVTKVTYPVTVGGQRAVDDITYDDRILTMRVVGFEGKADYLYDSMGRLQGLYAYPREGPGTGTKQYWIYDYMGRVTQHSWFKGGNNTVYQYDFLGRLVNETLADGTQAKMLYDDTLRSRTVVDASQHAVGYWTDIAGRTTSVREYWSFGSSKFNQTIYTYDDSGNLVGAKDPKGETTLYYYNELNLVNRTLFPDGTWEKISYFADGSQEWFRSRDGSACIKYQYDSMHRLAAVKYPSGAKQAKTFAYNTEGLLFWANATNIDNSVVRVNRAYDSMGRMTWENTTIISTLYKVRYEYDVLGRLRNITYPDRNGTIVKYSYDGMDRISEIKEYDTGYGDRIVVSGILYEAYGMGRLLELDSGNGVAQGWILNSDKMRIQSIVIDTSSFDRSIPYTYHPDGNVKTEGGKTYYYDGQDRLKSITGSLTANFTFDKNGNWLEKTESGKKVKYSYDKCNRMKWYIQPDNYNATVTYNPNGSVTRDKSSSSTDYYYDYDWDQQLYRVRLESTVKAKYLYDAFGRMVWSNHNYGKTSKTNTTLYMGSSPLYCEVFSLSRLPKSDFIYGPGGLLVARKDVDMSGKRVLNEVRWYHQNLRGDVVTVTDRAGRIVWNADYGPYGQISANVSTYRPDQRFTGELYDSMSQLYNFGFRQYSDRHGRFMTEDPVRSDVNQYSYCRDDPVNMVDPDGLFFTPETGFDLLCVGYDVLQLWEHPTWENAGWLLADIGCALVPAVPAVAGALGRGAKVVEKGFEAGRAAERGVDFARATERLREGGYVMEELGQDMYKIQLSKALRNEIIASGKYGKMPFGWKSGNIAHDMVREAFSDAYQAEKYLGKHSRVDFLLRGGGEIVEVKRWRQGIDPVKDFGAQLERYSQAHIAELGKNPKIKLLLYEWV